MQPILTERLKALNNMGAAQIKVEAYDVAMKSLDAVLRCQPDNVKALFRKGKVRTSWVLVTDYLRIRKIKQAYRN